MNCSSSSSIFDNTSIMVAATQFSYDVEDVDSLPWFNIQSNNLILNFDISLYPIALWTLIPCLKNFVLSYSMTATNPIPLVWLHKAFHTSIYNQKTDFVTFEIE